MTLLVLVICLCADMPWIPAYAGMTDGAWLSEWPQQLKRPMRGTLLVFPRKRESSDVAALCHLPLCRDVSVSPFRRRAGMTGGT